MIQQKVDYFDIQLTFTHHLIEISKQSNTWYAKFREIVISEQQTVKVIQKDI